MYGYTSKGPGALPLKLQILSDHGLRGVFFTEALFAGRFGIAPLAEIVNLILDAGQEVQLHIHTEWLDEMREPIIEYKHRKQSSLSKFLLAEQVAIISKGKELLQDAGVPQINAFRAGNFSLNRNTLKALKENNIAFDSSYNHVYFDDFTDKLMERPFIQSSCIEGVYEYPVTVFEDGFNHFRPLQLGSCSFEEMQDVILQAVECELDCVVISSHNFELMNRQRNRIEATVLSRFVRLCSFLEKNKDCFEVGGFLDWKPFVGERQPRVISSRKIFTIKRLFEQAWRRCRDQPFEHGGKYLI